MRREWALPLLLGLVVAAGLWAAMPQGDEPDGSGPASSTTSPAPRPALLAPFALSLGLAGANATFLLVAPDGQDAAEAALQGNASASPEGILDWTGGNEGRGIEHRLAFYTVPHAGAACGRDEACAAADGPDPLLPHAVPLSDEGLGPRLGLDGYNATRATIYVFDSRGLLFATNDAEANWTRFDGQPATIGSEAWYFGDNGTAPNGTTHLPAFARPLFERLKPQLVGLPVGGVASTQSNAYASLYGTLFVTGRIDELVYAP